MSDVSQGPGWWLASDGRWYPPTAQPGVPMDQETAAQVGAAPAAPQQHVGMTASLPGPALSPVLAVVAQAGFAVMAALNLLVAVLVVQTRSAADDYLTSSTNAGLLDWVDVEERMVSAANATFWIGIAVTVLFIVWSWRAHTASDRLRPFERKYGRGWTIGAWFIPVANLILPKLVIGEIERIAHAPRDGGIVRRWQSVRVSLVGWLWWIGHVAGTVLARVAVSNVNEAVESGAPDDLLGAYDVFTAATAIAAAGLVVGVVYVGRISRRLGPEAFARSNALDPVAPQR
ncbi:DUF4328 domain-containing protein [Actinomarinicola tropica]|uniref:DUF4328 domain-containing protein n=1 Tax=Actinomarinicola tropica TaxID=2789776 RepID=A0A5Q2RMC3_9ACTN|nr:DUF4328 domain-containing protein [Actinomarinicola tropica]QGG95010.1 DUF4328 domain-containing protein [Actinomarinicola tropica]